MSDKSREELEERVDELENTVSKMLPSRRQVLKGGATAAGAGMLGFSAGNASAQASTEDGDGDVGDPDDRVDVFSDGVDSNSVSTGDFNNGLCASEALDGLPSIQEAVNTVHSTDKEFVFIVGGENAISETITAPKTEYNEPEDRLPRLRLICAGTSYITQEDGANLDTLIKSGNGCKLDAYVNLSGNKANNSTDVTGVHIVNVGNNNDVKGNITECTTGVNIEGEAEDNNIDVWVRTCDVGVQEKDADDDASRTPDQNKITVRGHGNDGPYYRKAGGNNTRVHIAAEGITSGPGVELLTGSTAITGTLRGMEEEGVLVDGAGFVALDGLNLNALQGTATGLHVKNTDGGQGEAVVTVNSCQIQGSSNVDTYGIVAEAPVYVTDSRVTHFEVGIDLRTGSNGSYIGPSANISNVQTAVENADRASLAKFLNPVTDITVSLSGGEVADGIASIDFDRPHIVTAIADNESGNAHGYQAWSYCRADGEGRIAVEEKMNDGGGDARVMAFYLDKY